MTRLLDCRCDKPSPGGLTEEPCTRKATQEDILCDPCRQGCSTVYVGPAGGKAASLLSSHAAVRARAVGGALGFDLSPEQVDA